MSTISEVTTYYINGAALLYFCFFSLIAIWIFRPFSENTSGKRKKFFYLVECILFWIIVFNTTYFVHGQATILFCLLSFVVLLIFRPFSAKASRERKRGFIIVELILFGLLHWDIIIAGQQVSWMCRKYGGMHIYKRVESDSIAGMAGGTYWLDYGFSYVESYINYKGDIFRWSRRNGKVISEKVDKMTSRYIYKHRYKYVGRLVNKSMITKNTVSVVDRSNGSVLGEIIDFSIQPGWADQFPFIKPSGWSHCDCSIHQNGHYAYSLTSTDIIREVVKPVKREVKYD